MFAMIMGQENLHYYACADLGVTLFVFSVFLMLMLSHNNGSASVKSCVEIAKKSPAMWAGSRAQIKNRRAQRPGNRAQPVNCGAQVENLYF